MDSLQELIADMDARFTSGNSVPVRVTHLHATKWAEIRAALEAAQALQAAQEGGGTAEIRRAARGPRLAR